MSEALLNFQIHSHNPDSAEAEVCRALNAMKENIINNFDIPSKVYAKEVTKLTDEAACLMPNENNVKRNLRRIRNNSYPTISFKEFILEGKWSMTAESNQQKRVNDRAACGQVLWSYAYGYLGGISMVLLNAPLDHNMDGATICPFHDF
ncbi:Uncharacterized protein FWK35_00003032 [Aphis craccivora]|uniref:Uncharacterized protein n=1 Tax=Aphis craccivora TaxID=307492 RepID=A0A6G0ZG61_APHCR|nr:Uncharacterized protein FWK35_00003032 [Aphis craccivora]